MIQVAGFANCEIHEKFVGLLVLVGRSKYNAFKKSVVENKKLEEQVSITNWKRSTHQGSVTSYTNIYNECLSTTKSSV